jgi:transposase
MTTNNSKKLDINVTVGVDLGDKRSVICILDQEGSVEYKGSIGTDMDSVIEFFGRYQNPWKVTVAMETGTHSPWLSYQLKIRGFDVLVGNARKLRAIWDSTNKYDDRDAEMLARIARFDRHLLSPIEHRGLTAQMDLAVLKARDGLVRTRTDLINMVRGLVKASGARLPSCSAPAFARTAASELPEALRPALSKAVDTIAYLSKQIGHYDRQIERLCKARYPVTKVLQQITGVGPITSLGFILTLESPDRFTKSRDIGPFLGLVPKRDQSGESDKPLSITKAGDVYLRRLLVGCANYILGPFGPDCDLRRHGEKIASRGGKVARRKAKTAVARKLAIRLHHLWKTGETYHPLMKEAVKQEEAA